MQPIPFPAVDVHAHFLSPAYVAALAAAGIEQPDGFPHVPLWEVTRSLAVMDEMGVATAMLSVSSPGVHFAPPGGVGALARQVNEDAAAVVAAHPDRFGLLASLPLPDVDAALEEISHATDVLGADGFVMMTNYDGVYLADPRLAPVIDELDRRSAVVALHPTSPPGWEAVTLRRPRPMLEFPIDTTRCVVDLVLSRTLQRHPQINLIVPHVGSALTSLVDRVETFAALFLSSVDEAPLDVPAQLARLWYDLTGPALPHALPALQRIAAADRLLYGSDLPFPPTATAVEAARSLAATACFDDDARQAMFTGNALALFPRLRGPAAADHSARGNGM